MDGKERKDWLYLVVNYKEVSIMGHSSIHENGQAASSKYAKEPDLKYRRSQCYLRWLTEYKDELLIFESAIIDKDQKTVHMKILLEETGTIYFNPKNPKQYTWDLSFLIE
ncbi:MAG: hypothetical protein AAF487_12950 [Bacteroidota bacterium]